MALQLRIAACAFFVLTSVAYAKPGDTLYVQRQDVNVRHAPWPDAPVLMQLDRGHKLLEFERRGDWVNVGIDRTGGKDGWIHRSLVGPKFPGGGSKAQPDPKFETFRSAVARLNSRVREIAGVEFFSKIENLGDGIVQLTATDLWLGASPADRRGSLDTLFDLWEAADGSGLPIMVRIVDRSGSEVMKKGRQ